MGSGSSQLKLIRFLGRGAERCFGESWARHFHENDCKASRSTLRPTDLFHSSWQIQCAECNAVGSLYALMLDAFDFEKKIPRDRIEVSLEMAEHLVDRVMANAAFPLRPLDFASLGIDPRVGRIVNPAIADALIWFREHADLGDVRQMFSIQLNRFFKRWSRHDYLFRWMRLVVTVHRHKSERVIAWTIRPIRIKEFGVYDSLDQLRSEKKVRSDWRISSMREKNLLDLKTSKHLKSPEEAILVDTVVALRSFPYKGIRGHDRERFLRAHLHLLTYMGSRRFRTQELKGLLMLAVVLGKSTETVFKVSRSSGSELPIHVPTSGNL